MAGHAFALNHRIVTIVGCHGNLQVLMAIVTELVRNLGQETGPIAPVG